ncbi:MAG: hypothetical protein M0R03_08930 [Novosphingobium sp.]|nr:hypothetical protein [Novosphingobium sp.]
MPKYTKSTTVYTTKKEHQKTNNSLTIFENDWSTMTGANLPLSSSLVYDQGNFKIVTNSEPDFNKKYGVGEWICVDNEDGLDSGEECFWTASNLDEENEPVILKKDIANDVVVLKPDTSQLSNYAYFGSLFELTRSSFEDIIETFPASLWCVPRSETLGKYELGNDFEIDLYTDDINTPNLTLKTMVGNWLNNYEIVETMYKESRYIGGSELYGENILTDCKYNIVSFKQEFRYLIGNGDIVDTNEINNIVESGTIKEYVEYKVYGTDSYNDSIVYEGMEYKIGMIFIANENTEFITIGNASLKINGFIKQLKNVEFKADANDECCLYDGIRIDIGYYYHDDVDKCSLNCILCSIYDNEDNEITTTNSSNDKLKPNLSYHIIPKKDIIDTWFLELNDFQKVLLSRYTNPKYKSVFNIPVQSENGTYYIDYKFVWSTPDGWNLDTTSLSYSEFISKLSEVSVELDETKTDIIYRMLTHESIKNMTATSLSINDNETLIHEEYVNGSDKVAKLLRLFGRQFDEIKKYSNGISLINNVSYNEKDNLPDAYLKSLLSNKGWMTYSPII